MMHVICITIETRSVLSSKMINSWQYYNDPGEISHLQVPLHRQLLKVLLQSLHRTDGKHPGFSKMMQYIRENFYFPSIATYARNWVRDCEICIQDQRINNTRITPELIHIPERDLGQEVLMQINLLPELPSSGFTRISLQQLMFFQDMQLPNGFQPHGSKQSESHYRHYDKKSLHTYTYHNRRKKRFCFPRYTGNSRNT